MPTQNDHKAYLLTETGTRLDCMFNPATFQITLSNTWTGKSVAGQNVPKQEFGGSSAGTISGLELLFDTTDTGTSVTAYTDELVKLTKIDEDLKGYDENLQNGRPAWVEFHWGRFHSFKCVVTQLTLNYTYFSTEGEPLRARATLELTQYDEQADWPRQNPTSGTPSPSRSHQVQPGETLDRIAATYYDDATSWRHLARANGIRDPFALRPGARIDVPTLED